MYSNNTLDRGDHIAYNNLVICGLYQYNLVGQYTPGTEQDCLNHQANIENSYKTFAGD